MKKLYLVRHAESEGNIGNLSRGPITPLSEKGKKQKELIAERFKTIEIDSIISSPYIRAKETAKAIASIIGKEIIYSDLLVERKRASAVIGLDKNSPEYQEIESAILQNYHTLSGRHSDEENFQDLHNRAIGLFKHIDSLPNENILLVSHGFFTRMLIAHVLFKKDITSRLFEDFFHSTELSNTGITVLVESKFKDEPKRWKLLTWNDHAHLG